MARKSKPNPRSPSRRPARPQNPRPRTNTNVPKPTAQAVEPQRSPYEAGQHYGKMIGEGAGGFTSGATQGTIGGLLGVGEGLGKGIGGVFGETAGNVGGHIGKFGALYTLGKLLTPAVKTGYERLTESPTQKDTRIHSEEESKYRKKMRSEIMGTLSSFEKSDLDASHAGQDAVWRESIQGLDRNAYVETVKKAIKSDNPSAILDMVGRQARAKGKKPNTSKPLYLPNVFKDKDGKEYAYAIDASQKDDNGRMKSRFIKIPIGGEPFSEEK